MRFIQYWFGKPPEEITPGDVEAFIARATPAGHSLDYTGPSALPADLARQISALANAEGGLLVLGVEVEIEEDAKGNVLSVRPRALRGVEGGEAWEELRRSALGGISPPLQGVEGQSIDLPQGGVVVLLEVPQSPVGVHRAPDGRFYMRRGFLDTPMEPRQVDAVRARRGRPKLLPRLEIAHVEAAEGRLTVRIRLDNRGRKEAHGPRARLRLLGGSPGGKLPEGVQRTGARRGGQGELGWTAPDRIGPGDLVGSGDIPIRYQGDFAVEVEVSCEGLPAETTFFLIPEDVAPEVQRMLTGDEGWEVPPAERADIQRRWPGEAEGQRHTTHVA